MKDGHSDSLIPLPRNKSAVAQIFDSYCIMFIVCVFPILIIEVSDDNWAWL
jgi:hypothetical protein